MQLVIKNGIVEATYDDSQVIAHRYTDAEVITWNDSLPHLSPFDPPMKDPRTKEQKLNAYIDRRRNAYPAIQDQLDMLFHDMKNGTKNFVDAIESVKKRFPKSGVK